MATSAMLSAGDCRVNTAMKIHEIIRSPTNRVMGLEQVRKMMRDDPFVPPNPLYHLTLRSNLQEIGLNGLLPQKPRATVKGGIRKGEGFAGVWLTTYSDPDLIIDTHALPKQYYRDNVLLSINTSKLNPNLFSIGIEIPPRWLLTGQPISRAEYMNETGEIIYLGQILPTAIELV